MLTATNARASIEIARQTQLSRQIAQGQVDVSTMKRIHVASDDPAAAARVAEIRRTQATDAQYAANVEDGAATAALVDRTLTNAASTIDRARELMIQVKTGTISADARAAIAAELGELAGEIDDAAASSDARGRPLFPQGDPVKLPIGSGLTLAATVSRTDAFGNFAGLLRQAATAATNNDTAATQTGLDQLTAMGAALATTRAAQGARASRFDAAREALTDSGLDLTEERSQLEGTDLSATVAAIQSKLLTLQAAQAVFAKVNTRSLFDLL